MSKLAIKGGSPAVKAKVPKWPMWDEQEQNKLLEALNAGGWGGYPEPMPMAARFARKFANFHDARYGVMCANGSVALELALKAAGVKAYDEVIVPAYTWIATAAAPIHVNAVPVFVDSNEENYCIDPEGVRAAITDRTKAIIVVHLGASMADMDAIMDIARQHSLIVIEDSAHAHGARWRRKGVGSIGDFGSFSFQTSKSMTSGEGGIVITSNEEYAMRLHSLVNCGRKENGYSTLEGDVFGFNYRITEFQAGVLLAQLEKFEYWTKKKHNNIDRLRKGLEQSGGGIKVLPKDPRVTRQGVYQVVMKYNKDYFHGLSREDFIKAMFAEGVKLEGDFYVPVYKSELFRVSSDEWPQLKERYGDGIGPDSAYCPVAEKAAYEEALWMHHRYLLGDDELVDQIIEAVLKVQRYSGELV